jgi:hypothetical protein
MRPKFTLGDSAVQALTAPGCSHGVIPIYEALNVTMQHGPCSDVYVQERRRLLRLDLRNRRRLR